MTDFPIRPKVLRGAFVEYGLSLPPILFAFQFNPETLTRSRTASWGASAGADSSGGAGEGCRRRNEAQERSHLTRVSVSSETIGLSITLDATDELNDGDGLTQQFGVGPRVAALELMQYPKTDQLFGLPIGNLLGSEDQFGAASAKVIPILLFIWGRKKVLPVVMTRLQLSEQEFFPDLNPLRVTAEVELQVLEGFNPPYLYTHAWRIAQSALNLANIGDFANVF